jgi:uncharacterized membrane protein YdbT with pleckstrin-like domain
MRLWSYRRANSGGRHAETQAQGINKKRGRFFRGSVWILNTLLQTVIADLLNIKEAIMSNDINSTLGINEQVVYKAKIHWIVFVPTVLLFIIGFAASWIVLVVVGCITLVYALIYFFASSLFITNKRISGKVGLIKTTRMDTPLDKINNCVASNGLFGKIFGYGKIHVITSSGEYDFKNIAKVDAFHSALMQQIDLFKDEQRKAQAADIANAQIQAQQLHTDAIVNAIKSSQATGAATTAATGEAVFCTECGQRNGVNAKFCEACGAQLPVAPKIE